MSSTAIEIPGYLAGTWTIDPVHSDVAFTARHMMVSKVRGHFTRVEGEIVTGADPLASTVTASIDLDSIDTNNAQRDSDLRAGAFFDVDNHPTWTFRSTAVRADGDDLFVDGELTIKGRTRPVTLELEVGGFGPDGFGGTRAGFSGSTTISRSDFGVDISMPLDGGGVVVGDKVHVTLEIEGVLRKS